MIISQLVNTLIMQFVLLHLMPTFKLSHSLSAESKRNRIQNIIHDKKQQYMTINSNNNWLLITITTASIN